MHTSLTIHNPRFMKRTQIYLDEQLKTRLKTRAKLKGVSLSRYIRCSLRKQLESDSKYQISGKNALLKLANSAPNHGPSDLSEKVDDYLKDV